MTLSISRSSSDSGGAGAFSRSFACMTESRRISSMSCEASNGPATRFTFELSKSADQVLSPSSGPSHSLLNRTSVSVGTCAWMASTPKPRAIASWIWFQVKPRSVVMWKSSLSAAELPKQAHERRRDVDRAGERPERRPVAGDDHRLSGDHPPDARIGIADLDRHVGAHRVARTHDGVGELVLVA